MSDTTETKETQETQEITTPKAAPKKDDDEIDLRAFFKKVFTSIETGKESALPVQIAYCYLAIPMLIFLFGWLKLPIALFMGVYLRYLRPERRFDGVDALRAQISADAAAARAYFE